MKILPTPTLLIEEDRLRANITRMQRHCDEHGVALWPHIKTHKTVEIARLQLEAGAAGLTCAKLGEAEALLPSGARRMFIAYPLVDAATQAARVRRLADSLDELILAVTSAAQAEALNDVLAKAEVSLPVLMAVDTGMGREGARDPAEAVALADAIRRSPRMRLVGLFTHEGYAYRDDGADPEPIARRALEQLVAVRDRIGDPALTLWPGCSVTARAMAALPGVHAVRPGAYALGDLWLGRVTGQMAFDEVALTVLTTVVDRPQPGLALVDGGSKTFSSDKIGGTISASLADGRDLSLVRLSEEHGFASGPLADTLRVGERVAWVPAHVCPVVNLADTLTVVRQGDVVDTWRVAARGRVQ